MGAFAAAAGASVVVADINLEGIDETAALIGRPVGDIRLNIAEIRKPELDAQLVADLDTLLRELDVQLFDLMDKDRAVFL